MAFPTHLLPSIFGILGICLHPFACSWRQSNASISTVKLLALFNILLFGLIVVTTLLVTKHGPKRVAVVGWICAIFSVCVFAAPLSIMTPNVLGFVFGIGQMVLYMIYKGNKKQVRQMIQPKGGPPPPIVVDLGAILEMQEKPMVDVGVVSEIQDKDGVELRVVLEMKEKPVGGDEGGGDKKEFIAKGCVDLDGEKTVIPSLEVENPR
ncbi:hypothetical protein L1987_13104 [Smallanthus sonchifolius]|uniref:Uncharacterized protein n=1 Tax=Smallanthus sonchifolius TaxID=185202 RepID=A0ACB9JFJ7_9ASTR|nr:hypothetical protein L1987_13104 [Smallanthus sonchifolius]